MTRVSQFLQWFIRLHTSIARNLLANDENTTIPVLVNPWDMSAFCSSHLDEMLIMDEIGPFLMSFLDPKRVACVEHDEFRLGDVQLFRAIFVDEASCLYNVVRFEICADGLIVYHASGPSRAKALSNFHSSADTHRFVSQLTHSIIDRVVDSRTKEERKAVGVIESTWLAHALKPGGVLAERAGRSFAGFQNAKSLEII